jgi:hypothetical protein
MAKSIQNGTLNQLALFQPNRHSKSEATHARRVYSEHGIELSAPISAESVQNKQPLVAQQLSWRQTTGITEHADSKRNPSNAAR